MADKPIRICFIEDEQSHRDVVGKHLLDEGFEVKLYADGASALAEVPNYAPDVILVDILMPAMNGVEVIQKLRANGVQTPIIVLTNYEKHDIDKATLDDMKIEQIMLKATTSLDDLSAAIIRAAQSVAKSTES